MRPCRQGRAGRRPQGWRASGRGRRVGRQVGERAYQRTCIQAGTPVRAHAGISEQRHQLEAKATAERRVRSVAMPTCGMQRRGIRDTHLAARAAATSASRSGRDSAASGGQPACCKNRCSCSSLAAARSAGASAVCKATRAGGQAARRRFVQAGLSWPASWPGSSRQCCHLFNGPRMAGTEMPLCL